MAKEKQFIKFRQSARKGFVDFFQFTWTKSIINGKLNVKIKSASPVKTIGRKKLASILAQGKVRESCKVRATAKPIIVEDDTVASFFVPVDSSVLNYINTK